MRHNFIKTHTCERQTRDTGAGERHHWVYSQSGGCINSWTAHKTCCAGHLRKRIREMNEQAFTLACECNLAIATKQNNKSFVRAQNK